MCLFLSRALGAEELLGKVSWQLTPGQRFESATYNLIRNHPSTLTSPLNLGFTLPLFLFLQRLAPPASSSVFSLSLSADDQEVSAVHCLSLRCRNIECTSENFDAFFMRVDAFCLCLHKIVFFFHQRASEFVHSLKINSQGHHFVGNRDVELKSFSVLIY